MTIGLDIFSTAFAGVLAMAKAGGELLPETMRSTVVRFPKRHASWDHVPAVRYRQCEVELESRSSDMPLTTGQQFTRLSAIVNEAIGSAETAVRMQAVACQQLDLAQYGLSTLSTELSAVMRLPARSTKCEVRWLADGEELSGRNADAIAA